MHCQTENDQINSGADEKRLPRYFTDAKYKNLQYNQNIENTDQAFNTAC